MKRRWLLRFSVTCVTLLAVLFAVRMGSRSFIFPAQEVRGGAAPEGFEELATTAADGVTVRAFVLATPPHGSTVVYFHNNRDTAASRADLARVFHARGMGMVMVEYRGYGISRAGVPTEDGLYLDAEAVLAELASRGTAPDQIVLWGTSLGTGVAAEMARRGRGARLVLEAPYTSIPDLVTHVVPFAPASVLVADHFDTLAKSPDILVPTLVIHGDQDEIIPYQMGRDVADALPEARFVSVPGGHHGDLFQRRGWLVDEITAFGART